MFVNRVCMNKTTKERQPNIDQSQLKKRPNMKSAKKSVHVVVQLVVTVVRSHRAGGMANPAPAPAGAFPSEGLPPDADAADLVLPAVEMDTADDEEASSSWEALRSTLLPPDGASLPTTADGTFIPAFALLVNGSALNAWVKQPSPSCAAAVVAGAWNALACAGGRRDARAMGVRDVLDAMALGAETNLARRKARFARLLGVSSDAFDAFERAVLERIASDPSGATLGGRSKADPAMRRGDAMRVVEETATTRCAPSTTEGETEGETDADDVSSIEETCHDADDAFAAVAALLREEKAVRMTKTKTQENAASSSSENEPAFVADEKKVANEDARSPKQKKKPEVARTEKRLAKKLASFPKTLTRLGPPSAAFLGASSGIQSRNLGVSNDESADDGEASASGAASDDGDDDEKKHEHARLSSSSSSFDWRAEMWSVLKARAGLEKLRRDKPSTAAFGNAEVMRVFRRLVETNLNDTRANETETENRFVFSARVAFGIKTKTRPSLEAAIAKHASSDAEVETTRASHEWCALRALFARPGVFLVSHHANHYAPVYALRERREENANGDDARVGLRETREMLTARRGQRPAVWIPWEEARATMRRWSGYGIMAFERREA